MQSQDSWKHAPSWREYGGVPVRERKTHSSFPSFSIRAIRIGSIGSLRSERLDFTACLRTNVPLITRVRIAGLGSLQAEPSSPTTSISPPLALRRVPQRT